MQLTRRTFELRNRTSERVTERSDQQPAHWPEPRHRTSARPEEQPGYWEAYLSQHEEEDLGYTTGRTSQMPGWPRDGARDQRSGSGWHGPSGLLDQRQSSQLRGSSRGGQLAVDGRRPPPRGVCHGGRPGAPPPGLREICLAGPG
jgi:hypothetical protein